MEKLKPCQFCDCHDRRVGVRKMGKAGCKIKMLCKPHIYDFYCMWPGDGELTLKCKKCGKVKKLYVDVESFKGVFDKV